mmetsp:Transcript_59201/g.183539  ORF Transcript_59201/g.183539 Transcript_59201/m.183539 type:complete len:350 (+) Transcript_59201:593-1642(+)
MPRKANATTVCIHSSMVLSEARKFLGSNSGPSAAAAACGAPEGAAAGGAGAARASVAEAAAAPEVASAATSCAFSSPCLLSSTAARHSSTRPQASGGAERSTVERCSYQCGNSGTSCSWRAATAWAPMEKPATLRSAAWLRSSSSQAAWASMRPSSGRPLDTSNKQYGKSMASLGAVAAGPACPRLNCTSSLSAMDTPSVAAVSPCSSTRALQTVAAGVSGPRSAAAATSRAKSAIRPRCSGLNAASPPLAAAATAAAAASCNASALGLPGALAPFCAESRSASGACRPSIGVKACSRSAEAAPSRSTSSSPAAASQPAARVWRQRKPAGPSLPPLPMRCRYSGKPGVS